MLLADPEKYRDAMNVINKDIAYMSIELKKTRVRKYYLVNESQMAYVMILNY